MISLQHITKRFGALVANQDINLSLGQGEVLALLGENGAGKSTLMKILYGLYRPDAGEILVDGQVRRFHSPADAMASGIGMVTQHFALVPTLSVAENIVLGLGGFGFDRAAAERAVRATAEKYKLSIRPSALVRNLSVGEQQRVEIVKALHRNARVLILDEPTAVLTPQEAEALFAELKLLVAEGLSIVFISHHLDEVLRVADRVLVLRDGRTVGEMSTQGATQAMLAEMMVGRATKGIKRAAAGAERSANPVVLQVRDVWALNDRKLPALREVSFDIHAGEVLGLAGVSGNGQAALAEVLTGMRAISQGDIVLHNKSIANLAPSQVMAAGVGRIPEDRKVGVVGDLSVEENLALENLGEFKRGAMLDWPGIRANAERMIAEYAIKATPTSKAGKLSGGNMQKVILARVLSRQPQLVVAAQPTRGLDIGASEYVRDKLLAQTGRGAAILLISEDLEEIMALSDRIAVMFEGRIAGILAASDATPERLGLLMAGVGIES